MRAGPGEPPGHHTLRSDPAAASPGQLVQLAESRYVFLLVMHHIIGDGWSMNVLYREILALYEAYLLGKPDPLKPLRIQYKDFAVWQNAMTFERDRKYWLNQLADAPDKLRLPYDFPLSDDRDFAGKTEELMLPGSIVRELRALAMRNQHDALQRDARPVQAPPVSVEQAG